MSESIERAGSTPTLPAALTVGRRFRSLDVTPFLNNVAVTFADDLGSGLLNVWRNSIPAEEFPSGTREICGVPFTVAPAARGAPDNVRCDGQLLAVPPDRYDWLYMLGTSERRSVSTVALHFADDAVVEECLRLSDCWDAPPHFAETPALDASSMHYPHHVQRGVRPKLWLQRVPVTRRAPLVQIRLPWNVAMHVFALTLLESWEAA